MIGVVPVMSRKRPRNDYCTIYEIKNLINGKCYVGQTWRSLSERLYGHKTSKCCTKLARAFVKHGKENFAISPLAFAFTQSEANEMERHFIQWHDTIKSGYNINAGGTGHPCSEETRAKLAAANTGRRHSEETLAKMRESRQKRPPMTQETRTKLSESQKRRNQSEETKVIVLAAAKARVLNLSDEARAKLSQARKGKAHTEETKAKIAEGLQAAWDEGERSREGRPHSEDQKLKLSLSLKKAWAEGRKQGTPCSEETKAKKREHLFSEEHKAKISLGLKKAWDEGRRG